MARSSFPQHSTLAPQLSPPVWSCVEGRLVDASVPSALPGWKEEQSPALATTQWCLFPCGTSISYTGCAQRPAFFCLFHFISFFCFCLDDTPSETLSFAHSTGAVAIVLLENPTHSVRCCTFTFFLCENIAPVRNLPNQMAEFKSWIMGRLKLANG